MGGTGLFQPLFPEIPAPRAQEVFIFQQKRNFLSPRTPIDHTPSGGAAAYIEWYYLIYGTQCSGDDSSPLQPRQGLAPLDGTDTNVPRFRPYGRLAADCRRYTRYVQRYTQCSGVDPTPLQPRRGAGPVGQCGYKRTTAPALWAGWRQIAAATVGGTIFWVIPFIPTGYTSNVAGG